MVVQICRRLQTSLSRSGRRLLIYSMFTSENYLKCRKLSRCQCRIRLEIFTPVVNRNVANCGSDQQFVCCSSGINHFRGCHLCPPCLAVPGCPHPICPHWSNRGHTESYTAIYGPLAMAPGPTCLCELWHRGTEEGALLRRSLHQFGQSSLLFLGGVSLLIPSRIPYVQRHDQKGQPRAEGQLADFERVGVGLEITS